MNIIDSITRWSQNNGREINPTCRAWLDVLPLENNHRLLAVLDCTPEDCSASFAMISHRESLRTGLQEIVGSVLGPEDGWLVRWLLGRWPRGDISTFFSLGDPFTHTQLGIIAPLMPTRIALSESPLPFDRETVSHFKALHAQFGQPGLTGCQLICSQGVVAGLAGRWLLEEARIEGVLRSLGLQDQAIGLAKGLARRLGAKNPITAEVTYRPIPDTALNLEFGPLGQKTLLSLMSRLFGTQLKQTLEDAFQQLNTNHAFRLALTLTAEGVSRGRIYLPMMGDRAKGRW